MGYTIARSEQRNAMCPAAMFPSYIASGARPPVDTSRAIAARRVTALKTPRESMMASQSASNLSMRGRASQKFLTPTPVRGYTHTYVQHAHSAHTLSRRARARARARESALTQEPAAGVNES